MDSNRPLGNRPTGIGNPSAGFYFRSTVGFAKSLLEGNAMIKGSLPLTNFILAVLAALISSAHSTIRAQSPLIVVRSPNGSARIEFAVKSNDKGDAIPHYRVYYKDRLVVSDSRLG